MPPVPGEFVERFIREIAPGFKGDVVGFIKKLILAGPDAREADLLRLYRNEVQGVLGLESPVGGDVAHAASQSSQKELARLQKKLLRYDDRDISRTRPFRFYLSRLHQALTKLETQVGLPRERFRFRPPETLEEELKGGISLVRTGQFRTEEAFPGSPLFGPGNRGTASREILAEAPQPKLSRDTAEIIEVPAKTPPVVRSVATRTEPREVTRPVSVLQNQSPFITQEQAAARRAAGPVTQQRLQEIAPRPADAARRLTDPALGGGATIKQETIGLLPPTDAQVISPAQRPLPGVGNETKNVRVKDNKLAPIGATLDKGTPGENFRPGEPDQLILPGFEGMLPSEEVTDLPGRYVFDRKFGKKMVYGRNTPVTEEMVDAKLPQIIHALDQELRDYAHTVTEPENLLTKILRRYREKLGLRYGEETIQTSSAFPRGIPEHVELARKVPSARFPHFQIIIDRGLRRFPTEDQQQIIRKTSQMESATRALVQLFEFGEAVDPVTGRAFNLELGEKFGPHASSVSLSVGREKRNLQSILALPEEVDEGSANALDTLLSGDDTGKKALTLFNLATDIIFNRTRPANMSVGQHARSQYFEALQQLGLIRRSPVSATKLDELLSRSGQTKKVIGNIKKNIEADVAAGKLDPMEAASKLAEANLEVSAPNELKAQYGRFADDVYRWRRVLDKVLKDGGASVRPDGKISISETEYRNLVAEALYMGIAEQIQDGTVRRVAKRLVETHFKAKNPRIGSLADQKVRAAVDELLEEFSFIEKDRVVDMARAAIAGRGMWEITEANAGLVAGAKGYHFETLTVAEAKTRGLPLPGQIGTLNKAKLKKHGDRYFTLDPPGTQSAPTKQRKRGRPIKGAEPPKDAPTQSTFRGNGIEVTALAEYADNLVVIAPARIGMQTGEIAPRTARKFGVARKSSKFEFGKEGWAYKDGLFVAPIDVETGAIYAEEIKVIEAAALSITHGGTPEIIASANATRHATLESIKRGEMINRISRMGGADFLGIGHGVRGIGGVEETAVGLIIDRNGFAITPILQGDLERVIRAGEIWRGARLEIIKAENESVALALAQDEAIRAQKQLMIQVLARTLSTPDTAAADAEFINSFGGMVSRLIKARKETFIEPGAIRSLTRGKGGLIEDESRAPAESFMMGIRRAASEDALSGKTLDDTVVDATGAAVTLPDFAETLVSESSIGLSPEQAARAALGDIPFGFTPAEKVSAMLEGRTLPDDRDSVLGLGRRLKNSLKQELMMEKLAQAEGREGGANLSRVFDEFEDDPIFEMMAQARVLARNRRLGTSDLVERELASLSDKMKGAYAMWMFPEELSLLARARPDLLRTLSPDDALRQFNQQLEQAAQNAVGPIEIRYATDLEPDELRKIMSQLTTKGGRDRLAKFIDNAWEGLFEFRYTNHKDQAVTELHDMSFGGKAAATWDRQSATNRKLFAEIDKTMEESARMRAQRELESMLDEAMAPEVKDEIISQRAAELQKFDDLLQGSCDMDVN